MTAACTTLGVRPDDVVPVEDPPPRFITAAIIVLRVDLLRV